MRFWFREVAGWLLILLSLGVFALTCELLLDHHAILETGPMTVIAIILFRGGIHLLKVAMAARVCLHAQERLPAPGRTRTAAPVPRRTGPVTGTRPSAVRTP